MPSISTSTSICICVSILTLSACKPMNVNISNDNDNDNTNNANPMSPSPAYPVPSPTPYPGTGSGGPRVTDPSSGTVLPLPTYGQQIVNQVSLANPSYLGTACPTNGSNGWIFLDAVISALKSQDSRWGYACGASCSTISADLISYHATAGADVVGALGTRNVRIINNSCSVVVAPTLSYVELPYNPAGHWSPSRVGF